MIQREIKFRAWDRQLKGWVVEHVFFSEGKAFVLRGTQMVELTDADVVQFTGLKDKNKQDLFEGDIAFDAHSEEHGEIIFDEGCFYFKHEGLIEQLSEVHKEIEIVGDIYSNPTLLT